MKRLSLVFLLLIFAFFMACDQAPNPTTVEDSSSDTQNLLHKRSGSNPEPLAFNVDTARRVKPAVDNSNFRRSQIPADGSVLKVSSSDYPSIQAAVDAAVPGDKVVIADGHYWEDVFVFTPGIRITAANDGQAVIHGSFLIYFNAFVYVDNLVFNGDSGPYAGLDIWISSDIYVKNVTVNNHVFGIWLDGSGYCTVKNSTLSSNDAGFYLTNGGGHKLKGNSANYNDSYGIYGDFCMQVEMNRNSASNNGYRGMYMYYCDGSFGDHNKFNYNGPSSASVRLYDTWSTTFYNTETTWNNGDGLALDISNYNTFTDLKSCNNDGVAFVDNGFGNTIALEPCN
ncbi:MAG: hypothetical protein DWQ05_06520 [Calditrichaeota bacterium]|nr:MAG: hypothetical protein DWQ05_06520 [Calditrichota bacterium]